MYKTNNQVYKKLVLQIFNNNFYKLIKIFATKMNKQKLLIKIIFNKKKSFKI